MGMTSEPTSDELLTRARRRAEDLNLSTMGWRIPSDRLIDDFAVGEHGLLAQEHEPAPRRRFSLFPLEADPASAEPIAVLVEPESGGAWQLQPPDEDQPVA
jgi:hypothetical protein